MTTHPSDGGGATLGAVVGALRLGVGIGMIAMPGPVLRAGSGTEPSGEMVLLTRTIGVRDLVLGAGTLWGWRADDPASARRWVTAGMCSDVLDVVIGAVSVRSVGRRGALIAALAPVPFIALDVVAFRQMS